MENDTRAQMWSRIILLKTGQGNQVLWEYNGVRIWLPEGETPNGKPNIVHREPREPQKENEHNTLRE